ncbi:MAG: GntR family transcriptional regulator [Burkholderiales bacterium]|nr:MAG: GntR family transcriptional regulator [Burkholderiales bacterium]
MKASDTIRSAIEASVRSGALQPGDPIDEAALAEAHGVSRTPVREAILQLQAQGLLTALPRVGVVVAKVDVQQLFAMWELLMELESFCARLACERMTDEERAELARTHRRAEAVVADGDRDGWQDANLAFHECLYRGSRNEYLREEILRARTRTGAYRKHAFSAIGGLQASHSQHGEILAAVLARDPESAAHAMHRHMTPGQGLRSLTDVIVNLPRDLLV